MMTGTAGQSGFVPVRLGLHALPMHAGQSLRSGLSLAFVLLGILLAVTWVAGGASRPDAFGQVVVRGASWGVLAVAALGSVRPDLGYARLPLLFLLAALMLVVVQLVPLPPDIWQALPGRALFAAPATIAGVAQPWRPMAIMPDAAINAASSLVVPFATLVLVAASTERERAWLPALLLGLIASSTLLGLLQFSGVVFDNPLINDTPGDVNGSFANRNHLALFLAMGCLIAPAWASPGGRRSQWRLPVALGLILLFVLTILATGSRAGLLVGALGLVIGMLLVREKIRHRLRHAPRWVFPAAVIGILVAVALFVMLSVAADRAASIDRVFDLDAAQDMRTRGLPIVLQMIGAYFPVGTGFGSFDPVFRLHEPFDLLKPSYFNHAHNDFLEIILNGGLPGALLLMGAIAWWAIRSVNAWRGGSTTARLGSATVFLILVASVSDYPLRTPQMMAVLAIAALWMGDRRHPAAA